ncbi:AraC family transcriptional regulator [Flavobacterium pectinovorum]|uniref:helix-turn-helix domain-containing protein n=1 Tax=Flavobacterium pectinovorum TaxID=29533 RepID=UPI00265EE540|nr:AraC family transcriptional regulator [Flavobacterium pectinovorum]WKL49441.1 AraC family transcriptional regulator [Flavobacterium pectinovorum]
MKTISFSYSADLDWTSVLAQQLDGKIEQNLIISSETISTGDRFFMKLQKGVIVYYHNTTAVVDMKIIQKNKSDDFIAVYYILAEKYSKYLSNDFSYDIGRWGNNFLIIDSKMESTYYIKAGAKTQALAIFIKKSVIKSFAKTKYSFPDLDKMINPPQNSIIRLDRMNNESVQELKDLFKLKVGGRIFELHLEATVELLFSNYLKKVSTKRTIIQTDDSDFSNIVAAKLYLVNNIEEHFPSIKSISNIANMSESKFQHLFKKITGKTVNNYFMHNKLIRAKELLEENELTVSEISDRLHFTNSSHFASTFKKHFGILPKQFIKQL